MASLMSDVLKGVSDKKLIIPVSFPVLIEAVSDHSPGEEKYESSVNRGSAMANAVAVRGGVNGIESASVSSIQIDRLRSSPQLACYNQLSSDSAVVL